MKGKSVTQSCPTLCNPLETTAHQFPLSIRFFRREHWSGLLFPPSGDLPYPGFKSISPVSSALAGGFSTTLPPGKPHKLIRQLKKRLF